MTSSTVTEITTFLESKIINALSGIKRSPNYFAINNEPELQKYDYVYSVRPNQASPVLGTTGSLTLEQDFEIEIARKIKGNSKNDKEIRESIDLIYQDSEKLFNELSIRASGNIIVIKPPSYSAPEFDDNSKQVSITFTYPITFRKQISRGAP